MASSVLALAPRAAAAEPGARLVYLPAADAPSCPSEDVLRAAVVARVGRDPFVAGSPRAVTASLTKRGRGFVANVDLVDDQGIHRAHELMPPLERGVERPGAREVLERLRLRWTADVHERRVHRSDPVSRPRKGLR
jgi:hypothetical protein